MKFYASVCKSVCVISHAQTEKPTASKFGTEMPERVFEKILTQFFKNPSRVFREIFSKNIFLNFSANYSFIS